MLRLALARHGQFCYIGRGAARLFHAGRFTYLDEIDDVKAVPYQYRIKILTGNRRGAGTEAQVFASIVGTLGDTGERKLEPYMAVGDGGSIVSTTPFERNTWSEFELSVPGGLGDVGPDRAPRR
jgi:hypothetical protein